MTLFTLGARKPQLPEDGTFWVADNAVVIGDIALAVDVSIWFGAVLRGDNERITVGEGSNVQEHCILHTDMGFPLEIGAGCTIGHRAIIHGCTIGDNSLVGMGATVLNGAVIGNNCLIGANALIPENKIIPDNSLVVGMPGKVIRTLDQAAIDGIRETSQGYVKNWKRFKSELVSIE